MATWKKIIVSGSDAHLNDVTGSGKLKFPNLDTTSSINLKPLVIDSNGVIYEGAGSISSSFAVSSSQASTASYISSTNIDGQVGFPYSGSDSLYVAGTPDAAVITGSLVIGGGLAGNITASGTIIADTYHISSSTTKLADVSNSTIRLGDNDLKLDISASSLNINTSGGITASVVPQTTNPPFILAQTNNNEIVKVPLGSIGSSGGSNTVNNNVIDNFTTCSDNTNIGLTITQNATSQVESLIGQIIINDVGSNNTFTRPDTGTDTISTNQFLFIKGAGYESGSVNAGDKVRIKNNASVVLGTADVNATLTLKSIFSPDSFDGGSSPFTSSAGIWDNSNNRLVSKYTAYNTFHSASLEGSLSANDIYDEGVTNDAGSSPASITYRSDLVYHLYLVNEQTSSTVEICLDENLSVNNITQSGDLLFSGSLEGGPQATHSISVASGETLNISASNIDLTGNLHTDGNINLDGTLSFDGFTFSDGNVLVTSGSTTFGSGSGNKHEFTGSIFTSGSITLGENDKLIGTASVAEDAISSSFAVTASYIDASNIDGQVGFPYSGSDDPFTSTGAPQAIITGSLLVGGGLAGNITASGVISASGGFTGSLFGTASHAYSASFADTALTASLADTALTASYISSTNIDGQVGFPYSGSDSLHVADTPDAAVITGSLVIGGGLTGNVTASGIISASGGFTGSLHGSASYAITSSFALNADTATTASYIDASNIDGQVSFPFTGSAHISGNLSLDGPDGSITASGDISASGDITANNAILDGNLTVHGDLLISGAATTLHTQDLVIEDRFILIGSGSAAVDNVDVGIIFDSGSSDGLGMGLFFDNSANRLAIGTGITDVFLSNQEADYKVGRQGFPAQNPLPLGDVAGNLMTIRSTGSIGIGQSDAIPAAKDVKLGKGEMLIDEDDNIWMYVGS
tara:strand:+ start:245 stop:3013 length:2769 start_codon:yes stop_codon:yes gene_type:complete